MNCKIFCESHGKTTNDPWHTMISETSHGHHLQLTLSTGQKSLVKSFRSRSRSFKVNNALIDLCCIMPLYSTIKSHGRRKGQIWIHGTYLLISDLGSVMLRPIRRTFQLTSVLRLSIPHKAMN